MSRPEMAIVGVIDYGAGNIRSIVNAIEHLGARAVAVTRASEAQSATHLLLPGVGAFGFCAERLRASGLLPSLEQWALVDGRPLLGICVGMQLFADDSEELGHHSGLGWGGGHVRRLQPRSAAARVPHVGWNTVRFVEPFGDFATGHEADFYFDHSYAYQDPTHARTVASCDHGVTFSAVIRRGAMVAAQFHPEKSQAAGLRFLSGFLSLRAQA
jgi:glutamine amidotransferase